MPGYTYVATGSIASNNDSSALAPGAPAGAAVGNLLILQTGNRSSSLTAPALTGWTLVNTQLTNGTMALYLRIADGSADDTPSVDWSGTNDSYAFISAYSGDVYKGDLRGSVVRRNGETVTQANLSAPTLTNGRNNCLLYLGTQKNKTATSDNATTITAPASGSITKRAQLIMAGAALAAACGDVQQTTATDYNGTDWTIDGTAESAGGCGMAMAIRPNEGYVSNILFDTYTENVRTGTTSPQTFTHTPLASSGIKAVLLAITHGTSSTDHVSAASYGGTAMSRVQRNTDTATEPGATEWWFLGGRGVSIPQGAQTVSYTPGATTDDIQAVCVTLVADQDLEVIDTDGINNNVANPSVTLNCGGREMFCVASLYGGGAAPSSFVMNNNCQDLPSEDLGAFYASVIRSGVSQIADFAIGGVSASDDVAFSAVAVACVNVGAAPPNITRQAYPRWNYGRWNRRRVITFKGADVAGQTVAIGITTETDAAQAMGKAKLKALGLTTSTESAFAMGRAKLKALGLATTTELAQAMAKLKAKAIGLATSSETAQAMTRAKAKAIGLATSTEVAQALTHSKVKAIGLTSSTELAQAMGRNKTKAIGLATSTEQAFDITRSGQVVAIGLVAETDAAQPMGKAKVKAIGLLTETGLAQVMGKAKAKALGLNLEAATALSVSHAKAKALGLTTTTEVAQVMGKLKARLMGIVSETDLAQVMGRLKTKLLGLSSSTESAQEIRPSRVFAIGQAEETDEAQSFGHSLKREIGIALEFDTPLAITNNQLEVFYWNVSAGEVEGIEVSIIDPDLLRLMKHVGGE